MPLSHTTLCQFPGCTRFAEETHHIIYASVFIDGEPNLNDEHHHYCTRNKNVLTFTEHPEETVRLCGLHHQKITDLNQKIWRANRFHPLSCSSRLHWWKEFLSGFETLRDDQMKKRDERFAKHDEGVRKCGICGQKYNPIKGEQCAC